MAVPVQVDKAELVANFTYPVHPERARRAVCECASCDCKSPEAEDGKPCLLCQEGGHLEDDS